MDERYESSDESVSSSNQENQECPEPASDNKQLAVDDLLRMVFESSPTRVFIKNKEGIYLMANKVAGKSVGIETREMIGKTDWDFVELGLMTDSDAEKFKKREELTIESGEASTIPEESMTMPSGKKKWFFTTRSPISSGRYENCVLTIAADITESKRTKKKLEDAYEIINRSPSVAFLWENKPRWPVKFVSDNSADLLGYTPEESMRELTYDKCIHPDDLIRYMREVETFSADPKKDEFTHEPYRIITKDGKTKWVQDTTFIRRDENGRITHYQALVHDITQQIQIQNKLERQRTELSDFANSMSHDIGNLLYNISTFADMIQMSDDSSEVRAIKKIVKRASKILRRSVQLADAGEIISDTEVVDLNELVTRIANETIPPKIEIVIDDLPMCRCDAHKISQVFHNLFLNAVEHGNPTVIEVRMDQSNNKSDFLIINDGDSITEEDTEMIFQRGFTTKERRGGLGLNIVKRIVEAHGGKIVLDEEKRTTFRLSLDPERIITQSS